MENEITFAIICQRLITMFGRLLIHLETWVSGQSLHVAFLPVRSTAFTLKYNLQLRHQILKPTGLHDRRKIYCKTVSKVVSPSCALNVADRTMITKSRTR